MCFDSGMKFNQQVEQLHKHTYIQIHASIFFKVVDYVTVQYSLLFKWKAREDLDASLLTLKPHT